jgi:hypothetical protein
MGMAAAASGRYMGPFPRRPTRAGHPAGVQCLQSEVKDIVTAAFEWYRRGHR